MAPRLCADSVARGPEVEGGQALDSHQELLAVGAANLASGVMQGLAAFPTAALGAIVVYAATRLIDVAEFLGTAAR